MDSQYHKSKDMQKKSVYGYRKIPKHLKLRKPELIYVDEGRVYEVAVRPNGFRVKDELMTYSKKSIRYSSRMEEVENRKKELEGAMFGFDDSFN
jgi:hypothetical protein